MGYTWPSDDKQSNLIKFGCTLPRTNSDCFLQKQLGTSEELPLTCKCQLLGTLCQGGSIHLLPGLEAMVTSKALQIPTYFQVESYMLDKIHLGKTTSSK